MQKTLTAAERLIVAADFKPMHPHGREGIRRQVLALADSIAGTGICLKVNSALRACGYRLIDEIHDRGLKVFADLKLFDIPETLETDGLLLLEAQPELLTVVCTAGVRAIQSLKHELPHTEVLGVTVLTSLEESDTHSMFGCSIEEAAMRFSEVALSGGSDGLICAPKEVERLKEQFGTQFTYNTPGVRQADVVVANDDQNPNRIMTPAGAIRAGATRIVAGRQITKAADRYAAAMGMVEEIASAL